MKISDVKVLTSSIAILSVMACSNGPSTSSGIKPAAVTAKSLVQSLNGACSGQAIPEITQADGKEIDMSQLPQGEYDYASGEMYVYAQGPNDSQGVSKLEALVSDKPDETGSLQSQMMCTQVDSKAPVLSMTSLPMSGPLAAASPAPSASPATSITAGAEFISYMKITVNADGSISTSGLRRVFTRKDPNMSSFIVVPNSNSDAVSNFTQNQLKDFSPEKQFETHYFLSDKGLTIISRQGVAESGTTNYSFMKVVFKKAAQGPSAAPAAATASATSSSDTPSLR